MLDGVNFLDNPSREELASCFADVVTQIAQDVGFSNTVTLIFDIFLAHR